jgi:hypothetical protein
MTRRGVLTGAAAIAGVTALPQFLNAHPAVRGVIGHVVVDERLIHSAAFAAGISGSRIHTVSALDDLCNRWYTQLRRQVLAEGGHIAGLTTWIDYVVMRGCAAEIGYVGTFHAEHLVGAGGVQYTSWAQAMGAALAAGAHLRPGFVPGVQFSAMAWPAAAHGRLMSWVFSPRAK